LNSINVHIWDQDIPSFNATTYFNLLQQTGTQWAIFDVGSPYSSSDTTRTQLFVNQCKSRGIKVLGLLDSLIMAGQTFTALAQWNQTVTDILALYGSTVDAWQIWNEPNFFTLGYQDGTYTAYSNMVQSTYPIIKAANSSAIVVAGSLAPITGADQFMYNCSRNSIMNYCDVWGYHFYNTSQDSSLKTQASYAGNKPIWITESGADSLDLGLNGQATQLSTFDAYFKTNQTNYRIALVSWYCFIDYATVGSSTDYTGAPTTSEDFYGLVTLALSLKPAYTTYQSLTPQYTLTVDSTPISGVPITITKT
jgi:hypothetical protein